MVDDKLLKTITSPFADQSNADAKKMSEESDDESGGTAGGNAGGGSVGGVAFDKTSITKQSWLNSKQEDDDEGGGGGAGKKRLRGFAGENLLNAINKGVLKNTGHVKNFADRHIGSESLEKLPLSKDSAEVNTDSKDTQKLAEERVKGYLADATARTSEKNPVRRSAEGQRGNFFGNNASAASQFSHAQTKGNYAGLAAQSWIQNASAVGDQTTKARFAVEAGSVAASAAKSNEVGAIVQQRNGGYGNFLEKSTNARQSSGQNSSAASVATTPVSTPRGGSFGRRGG